MGDIEYPDSLSEASADLLKIILDKNPQNRIGILDILEHRYLKDSLSCSLRTNRFLQSGH